VTDDTNLPSYQHISIRVPSMKGLEWLVTTYADDNGLTSEGWHAMLRPGAVKHVVVVSDDGDETTADAFDAAFRALDPLLDEYQFHGIFAYSAKDLATDGDPCATYAAPSSPDADPPIYWDTYSSLVDLTDGVSGDLCLQDFEPVFDAIGTSVITSSQINCEWQIPEPPAGETLNPDLVNVEFISSAAADPYLVGRVDGPSDCDAVANGWYYDDPVTPGTIFVCPQTCEWFQSLPEALLNIQFGCETHIILAR